jgi:hypothetical protein
LEKKTRIDNCQEEGGNASNHNEPELPKSAEGDKDKGLWPDCKSVYGKSYSYSYSHP